jgi:type I restriction enzyme M protein
VFSDNDLITMNDRVLAYVVGELSRYNLLKTDVDVKGAAYEEITASVRTVHRGQFFTPTNVIQLMVQMMDPGGDADLTDSANWPRILDPACGSGRFLTYALDHVQRKMADQLFPDEHRLLRVHHLDDDKQSAELVREYARQCLYGIESDPVLKRASRMNMLLNNDGHGNILSFNSLEYPTMLKQSLGETRAQYGNVSRNEVPDPARAHLDVDLGTFDFVFTNPPFGTKIPIDDRRILQQFDLARRWRKQHGRWIPTPDLHIRVAPEVLFVERCVRWVKPGTGKVAIVLPDGILGNPDSEYIRVWILQHCQVLDSVDLPVEAFLPQVGVQASLLFLRRKSQAEMDAEALGQRKDYPVFMAIAENVGHDRRGNDIYRRDADGAEIFCTRTYDVLQRQKDVLVPVTVTCSEKLRDDDLPRIGEMYRHFLKTGEVPE